MAETVTVRFVRDVGNTPRGTVREVGANSRLLQRGVVEKVTGAKAEKAKEADREQHGIDISDPESLSVADLKLALGERGLDTRGRKDTLLKRLREEAGPVDFHKSEGYGGEAPGEGVHPEEAANSDLTDNDGADVIVTEDHFAGESNDGETGVRIDTTDDFAGESDPDQEAIVAPGGDDDDDF